MALKIDTLRDQRSSANRFVATRRLLLTKDDEVVEAGDPAGVRLLVAAGAAIPIEVAKQYGLVEGAEREQRAAASEAAAAAEAALAEQVARAEAERAAAIEDAYERGRQAGREEAAAAASEKAQTPSEDKAQEPSEDKGGASRTSKK